MLHRVILYQPLQTRIEIAVDSASGWILGEPEEGKPIPDASDYKEIIPDDGGFLNLIATIRILMLRSIVRIQFGRMSRFQLGGIPMVKRTTLVSPMSYKGFNGISGSKLITIIK